MQIEVFENVGSPKYKSFFLVSSSIFRVIFTTLSWDYLYANDQTMLQQIDSSPISEVKQHEALLSCYHIHQFLDQISSKFLIWADFIRKLPQSPNVIAINNIPNILATANKKYQFFIQFLSPSPPLSSLFGNPDIGKPETGVMER